MPQVIVVVPTLVADAALAQCLRALARQSWRDFETVVVDNSSRGAARRNPDVAAALEDGPASLIEAPANIGYGAAVNLGAASRASLYVAALNDDAVPQPGWLAALVAAMASQARVGMCASSVRIAGEGVIDSAGMLLCGDGSSRQRGHGEPAARYAEAAEVLLPSGSAALYRRAMLDEIGWFDERFFLYCEDVDLGLRARWAGWSCLYVPEAAVDHRYSHSSGPASALKAYYVERNRVAVVAKNFPLRMLAGVPFHALLRYWWHLAALVSGRGAAGRFRREGAPAAWLVWYVIRAHLSLAANAVPVWRQRRAIFARARLTPREFHSLVRRHSISAREVAAL